MNAPLLRLNQPTHAPLVAAKTASLAAWRGQSLARMWPRLSLAAAVAAMASAFVPSASADSIKAANTTALNLPGSWTNGIVPGPADLAIWDSTVTVPNNSALGGDLSWLGIRVTNVSGARNGTQSITIGNGGSANTLTLGASGIDMSNAFHALLIQSRITISANQTWNVANANTNNSPTGSNNGEDLSFASQAANIPMNFGGNTVTATGAGNINITGGYVLSNGTLNVSNPLLVIQGSGGRDTTLANTMTLGVETGGSVRLQANSGGLLSNAAINLNGGNLNIFVANAARTVVLNGNLNVLAPSTLSVTSSASNDSVLNGNLTGSAALTLNNTSAANTQPMRFAGDNSGYSGTFTLGGTAGKTTRLSTATAGSAAATWVINTGHTLEVNGVTVNLGTLSGAGGVTNSDAAANPAGISVGAGTYSGAITDGLLGGTMSLTKVGNGTLSLTGLSTYTGPTAVHGGTLLVTPTSIAGTPVNVAGNATFAVQSTTSGTLNSSVTVADGGTFITRTQAPGVTITVPNLSVGTSTGGLLILDTGVAGNPASAPLVVGSQFSAAAGTKIRIAGSSIVNGTFPAIAYTGAIGGGGFAGLSLELPFRVTGNLVNNAGVSVNVNVTGTARPVWRGNINANWDIDSVGNGTTGTPNWFAISGPNTYVQAPVGTDSVVFDDTATGTTNINLTTTLSPIGVSVNNGALNYTFSGPGRISGTAVLSKTGSGALTIANAGVNDFSSGAFLDAGTVTVGNGATAGAGSLGTGPVAVAAPATLVLHRPDNFTLANVISGAGALTKNQANTATISGATTLSGPVEIAAGTLQFTGGGNLSGAITGAGALNVSGGLQLSGPVANTFSGLTTVSGGVLQLNKTAGINALAGDLLINGTGLLALSQANQIPDTATVTVNKTGQNQGTVQFGFNTETIGTLNVIDGNDIGTQVQVFTGFVVAGNVNLGGTSAFSITSGSTFTTGGLTLTGNPIVRVSANSNPSTLNIGENGLTAAGGTIQVAQALGTFDAVLNLGGNYTGTGNVAFTDGGFTGFEKREINLGASDRTFELATGTTTTIAPDIAGTGGIIKTGSGTLQLTGASNSTYTGATTVNAGSFLTTTSQIGGGNFAVSTGATLGLTVVNPDGTLAATDLTTAAGSTLLLNTEATGNPTMPIITGTGAFNINGATTLRLRGTALSTATGIPLIDYGTLGGTSGFAGLSIVLPTRASGSLVNNATATRIDLNLLVEQIRWSGEVNGNWDIDPDGTGATGTNNWRTTVTNLLTRYFQGPTLDRDTVFFTDAATGTTTVNFTTSLSPVSANVENATKTYTFTGAGKLTGSTVLNKSGTGTLILANTVAYDHVGGTNIGEGTLQIGDGVTAGAGLLPINPLTNNGTLVLNRPDDFSISTTITGEGTINKLKTNAVTFAGATTYNGPININAGTVVFGAPATLGGEIVNAGTLNFTGAANVTGSITNTGTINSSGGGTIAGAIAGPGALNVTAGMLNLNGFSDNTYTGLTTVSGGDLRLQNFGGNAVAGNILITGAGRLVILADNQISDTATITFNGTSADATAGSSGFETVANLVVNAAAPTGQFTLRSTFDVTNTTTLQAGILTVDSFATATLNAINLSGGTLRLMSNLGPAVLNVGPGGITASGGQIQLKTDLSDNDSVLNLGGNFTATGNLAITDANYNGSNQHIIDLAGSARTFNIAAATTTTVAPDIGDGTLIKQGAGTLALNGKLGTTGAFTLTANAGNTTINESQTIAALNIGAGGTVTLATDVTPGPLLVTPVPEPGALTLLAFGALGCCRRRRSGQSQR